jgi:hypothetical protein
VFVGFSFYREVGATTNSRFRITAGSVVKSCSKIRERAAGVKRIA